MPKVVVRDSDSDSSSDSDSESYMQWRDYYGDDERGNYDSFRCTFITLYDVVAGRTAAKIARKDSLAMKLSQRPDRRELEARNIIPAMTDQERMECRENVSHKLTRRLSLRPTPEELEQRNILKTQTPDEMLIEKEQKKKMLDRKVSVRQCRLYLCQANYY